MEKTEKQKKKHRASQAKYRALNRDAILARRRAAPKNPNSNRDRRKRRMARHPEKHSARRIVRLRVRRGTLIRGSCACLSSNCGGQIEGHHLDYNIPLAVMWLCKEHHKAWHRVFLAEEFSPELSQRKPVKKLLTVEQVLKIKELRATTTLTTKEIAAQFGVHPYHCNAIFRGARWKNVGGTNEAQNT